MSGPDFVDLAIKFLLGLTAFAGICCFLVVCIIIFIERNPK